MKKINKENIINIIILIIYASISFFIMTKHEPWRDEAQAWLLAKDLSLQELIQNAKYEGHPCLWHLILMPFAKLGFPYITLNIISWLCMLISAILIIYKAPFNKLTKIFILISSPFIYTYISISRVYSLIALLLIVLAMLYKNKEKRPCLYGFILLLVANTHIIMLGLVGILILEFYIKDIIKFIKNKEIKNHKNLIIGFAISLLGIILLILQLMGSLSANNEVNSPPNRYMINLIMYIEHFTDVFVNLGDIGNWKLFVDIILIILILVWQLKIFKECKKIILIFWTSLIYQIAIFVIVYKYGTWAFLNVYFIFIFCIWILYNKNINKKILNVFNIILIVISFNMFANVFNTIKMDIKYNYSASKEMAQYINENINEGSIIVAATDYTASSIVPYCKNYLFYSPQRQDYFTYIKWDAIRKRNIEYEEFESILQKLVDTTNKDVYILYSKKELSKVIEKMIYNNEISELFRADIFMAEDEIYYLYEIK